MTIQEALKLSDIVKRPAWKNNFYKVGYDKQLELYDSGRLTGNTLYVVDLLATDWVALKPKIHNQTVDIGGIMYEVISS